MSAAMSGLCVWLASQRFFVVSCGTCQRESIVVEPGGACGQLGNPSCPQIHGAVFFAKEDCKMGVGIEALFFGIDAHGCGAIRLRPPARLSSRQRHRSLAVLRRH